MAVISLVTWRPNAAQNVPINTIKKNIIEELTKTLKYTLVAVFYRRI